ncbi:MAG: hypothetical protein ACI8Y7_000982 [Candidatus Woesearchaeota archaeon]|jgi:hypothetical protein
MLLKVKTGDHGQAQVWNKYFLKVTFTSFVCMYITKELQTKLVADVRQKKDLKFLSADFIIKEAQEFVRVNKKPRDEILAGKEKPYKELIKRIRAKARKPYAIFQVSSALEERKALLATTKLSDKTQVEIILTSHLSTKERMSIYPELLSRLEPFISTAKNIQDIGCGLNPVAYYLFSKHKKVSYTCNEFSELECEQLNTFFSYNKLNAKAITFSLLDTDAYDAFFKQCDVCFAFKIFDTLEHQHKYVTYELLEAIKAKVLVASFPIVNIKGERMNRNSAINWFEKMLGRKEKSFEAFELGGEIFYIVT